MKSLHKTVFLAYGTMLFIIAVSVFVISLGKAFYPIVGVFLFAFMMIVIPVFKVIFDDARKVRQLSNKLRGE